MTKEEIVSSMFFLTNKLKDVVKRKGWHDRDIKRFRVESVADHIYGCQMLAHAMYSEFDYDIDLEKVLLMLAVHEIGETIIGDITPDDMDSKKKSELEREVVLELLSMIPNGDFIKDLFLEFADKETKEAQFAYFVDKAECDLQAKLYTQEGCFSHKYNPYEFINNWIDFDRNRIPFDKNFDNLLKYVLNTEMIVTDHTDNPYQNVISFYTLTNSLKDKRRTGEKIWNVNKENYGSIAEHTYSVEMLEVIINLIYKQDIDIKHVVAMTSVHELGEIEIGDISALLKTDQDREDEFKAAQRICSILTRGDIPIRLLCEFNNGKTKDAIYSKYNDKLAPDMISKIYDQLNLVDLDHQEGNKLLNNEIVKRYLGNGESWSNMWMLYGQEVYKYPEPFMSISNYVLNNGIDEPYTKVLKRKEIQNCN